MQERLRLLAEALGISMQKLALSIKASPGYIRSMTGNMGTKFFVNLLRTYPNVSALWILTGEGEMFLEPNNHLTESSGNNISIGSVTGSNQIIGGNSINVSLPEEGMQKIIRPDGTVIIEALDSHKYTSLYTVRENAPKYGTSDVRTLEKQLDMNKLVIESQQETIRAKGEIIEYLKNELENLKNNR